MDKNEFLQLVKLDDSITQLNLGVMYDGVDATEEVKFFVTGFPDNLGIFFVVDLDDNSLTFQLAKFEEKIKSPTTQTFNSEVDALSIIRDIITQFYLFAMIRCGI
jgi:hypothetical protein